MRDSLKKILFFAFASYVIGALLAVLVHTVNSIYPGVALAAVRPTTGNLIEYVIIVATGIIVLNVVLYRYKNKATAHFGNYFNIYIYLMLLIMTVCLAVYAVLTAQLLFHSTNITGGYFDGLLVGVASIIGSILWFLKSNPKYFNAIAMLLGVMAIVLLSNYPPLFLLILFAGLAVYDYIAVFHLKTMLTLANIALDEKNPLPMLIKEGDVSSLMNLGKDMTICSNCSFRSKFTKKGRVWHFECPMCHRKVHNPSKNLKTLVVDYAGDADIYKQKRYREWFWNKPVALGMGDLCIPGVVIASLAINYGLLSVFALIGAYGGLLANMYVLFRLRRPLPALPLIFIGLIIALGIGVLLLHIPLW